MKRAHSLANTIGQAPPRKEGVAKVTGQAQYVDDLVLEGGAAMIHGVTVRTTAPRGRITDVRFRPGVPWDEITIVSAADIAASGGKNAIALIEYDQPCLADGFVNHPEEAVLLIGHRDRGVVERARNLIDIVIEPHKAIFDMGEALQRGATGDGVIWGRDNVFKRFEISKGDVAAGFAAAEVICEGTYDTGAQEQLYIEPQGMLAHWDEGGSVTIIGSMQCPYYIHKALMYLLALPAEKVRIIQSETGGGFGGKEEYPSMLAAHVALLSRKAGRPAKIIYDRIEDMVATTKRHPSRSRVKTGWRRDGTLVAQDIDFLIDGGAYLTLSPVVLSRGGLHAAGPYACDNVRVRACAVATNAPPHGAFRGFGAPQSVFAFERHLDEVAAKLGLEPDALRRRNFVRDGQTLSTGQIVRDHVEMSGLLDRAMTLSDFSRKRAEFADFNRAAIDSGSPHRRGIGLAAFMHGCGFTGSGERMLSSVVAVDAGTDDRGVFRVRVRASSTEIGQGTNTIFTQIAAETLGLPGDLIEIVRPDTGEVPNSGPTVASRTCMVVGRLVENACKGLILLLRGAELLGETPSAADFQAACVEYQRRIGVPRASAQYQQPPNVEWDDKLYRGDAYATYAWAVYVAEVDVDLLTYETRIRDFWAVQEVGKVVHPILAAGQIEGGVAQAIGYALYEKVVWKEGRMQNGQMTNYIMPTSMDVPPIRVEFAEVPTPHGPRGAKGIGELPMDGPAPAIINAIGHATAFGLRAIPLLPEDLMVAADGASCR